MTNQLKPYVTMTDVMNEIFKLSREFDNQKAAFEMAKLALKKITMAEDADINCLADAIIIAQKTLELVNNVERGLRIEPKDIWS